MRAFHILENDENADEESVLNNDKSNDNSIQEVSIRTAKHFGLKFSSAKQKIKHSLDMMVNTGNLKFIINPDLQDTWLQHPKGNDTEPIGSVDTKRHDFFQEK